MAEFTSRIASEQGWENEPLFRLSALQFQEAETAYGKRLSSRARNGIIHFCQVYLHNRYSYKKGFTVKDVMKNLEHEKQLVEQLTRMVAMQVDDLASEPRALARHIFTEVLNHSMLSFRPHNGCIMTSYRGKVRTRLATEVAFYFDTSFLVSLLSALERTVGSAESAISNWPEMFLSECFEQWVFDMRRWANNYNLPVSEFTKDGSPGPLPRLMHYLSGTFPAWSGRHPRSAEAMAEAVTVTRRALKRRGEIN